MALVEIGSIARGYVALDAIAKRAQVHVKFARPMTPGKFVLLFGGSVADTEEALEAAREIAASDVVDELFLPQAHAQLLPAIDGNVSTGEGEAIGIVETTTVAACLLAADVALKACETQVLKMHLAIGIGGKGYFTLAGDLADVDAALDSVRAVVAAERLIATELIPRPHGEVRGWMA